MVKLRLCILVILLNFLSQVQAQEINFGLGTSSLLRANLTVSENPVYYFADDLNSVYTLETDAKVTYRSFAVPFAYFSYYAPKHLFFRYNLSFQSYLKNDKVIVSNNVISGLEKKVQYKSDMFQQALSVGYVFTKTREIQPYLGLGLEHRYNYLQKEVSAKPDKDLLKNDRPRGEFVDAQMQTLQANHLAYQLIMGFEYYIINLNVTVANSIGEIDKTDFYKNFNVVSLNFALRLFHKYHKSKVYRKQKDYF